MLAFTNHNSTVHEDLPAALQRDGSDSLPALPALATLGDQTLRDLVQLFRLLADETRLRILYFLTQKDELNVRTLCRLLDESQPAVSHHLAMLRVAGIIECRRDGKNNFYRLMPKRCQAYLDVVFGVTDDQTRQIRVEDATLTYGRERPVAS
jgi:ArsR family transcriptional regulator